MLNIQDVSLFDINEIKSIFSSSMFTLKRDRLSSPNQNNCRSNDVFL